SRGRHSGGGLSRCGRARSLAGAGFEVSSGSGSSQAGPGPGLVLGAAAQTGLSYLSFRNPRYFWGLMTVGLSASALPGLRRLRQRPSQTSSGWLGLGLLAGLAGYALTAVGALLARRLAIGRRSLEEIQQCAQGVSRPWAALLVIPAGMGEEIFWREAVLAPYLEPGQSEIGALVGSTLVYAAVQAGSLQPLPPLGALLLGAGAGWLRIRSGSIWPAVAAHLVYSELCFVAPGLPRVGPKRPK
ncbi:MAG: CPBP family intramembrane glutamic endopeptidase, partial [Candidatus Dormiibacterota bacterium]